MCSDNSWGRRSDRSADLRIGAFRNGSKPADLEIGAPMAMHSRAEREFLRDLVVEKNKAYRPLTAGERALGFLGWQERGYLPHCDFRGLVQFVTFRPADSMPASRRGEWEHLLTIEDVREKRIKLEEYFDHGMGECQLREPRIAKLCDDALLFFHSERCGLLAWCVLLNHAHVLVHVWPMPLWKRVAPFVLEA